MCELERRAATDLPVGIEVGGGDLQCDPVLRFLVHLLRDEAGLLHQQVGPNDLLAQLTQAPDPFVQPAHRPAPLLVRQCEQQAPRDSHRPGTVSIRVPSSHPPDYSLSTHTYTHTHTHAQPKCATL